MSEKRPDSVPCLHERPAARLLPEPRHAGRGDHDDEIADAAWLYAWSHEALCPLGERLSARLIAVG